jgi:hypothetical protein
MEMSPSKGRFFPWWREGRRIYFPFFSVEGKESRRQWEFVREDIGLRKGGC